MRFLPIFASTLAAVAANPLPEGELEKRQAGCNANNVAFRVISNLGPRGSIFCNDYLSLPTSFATTTLPTPASLVVVPSPFVTGPCLAVPGAKREAEDEAASLEKRQIPGLALFAAGRITEACSCLSLAPRTSTLRITPLRLLPPSLGAWWQPVPLLHSEHCYSDNLGEHMKMFYRASVDIAGEIHGGTCKRLGDGTDVGLLYCLYND